MSLAAATLPKVNPQPKTANSHEHGSTWEKADLAHSDSRELVQQFGETFKHVLENLRPRIIGLQKEIQLILAATFVGGHVSLEGKPGMGKTMLARGIAESLGLDFKRIQFTPDLVPSDITGSNVLDQKAGTFDFRKGPVFANIVLADEINRSGPKTQSALLEAMAEGQISYDGVTHPLPKPLLVIATQNPMESHGTYPLPDAQLDRFFVKIKFTTPSMQETKRIMQIDSASQSPIPALFSSPEEAKRSIAKFRDLINSVAISDQVYDDMVQLLAALNPESTERKKMEIVDKTVDSGPSPRGAAALQALSRVYALLDGRHFVQREDVIAAALPTLAHRLILKPTAVAPGSSPEAIINEVVKALFENG